MRRLFRSVCLAFAWMPLALVPAHASDCKPAAIEALRTAAPDGFAIYQRTKDKAFFLGWISCGEKQFGLSTGVHESVHYITAETDAFPLVGGGQVKRPQEVSAFFAPSRIADKFKDNDFVSTYLKPGQASSSTDFLYLLDELNAYTHDLHVATALNGARGLNAEGDEVDHRDGLAALMAFTALYVEHAQTSEPATWHGLKQPRVAKAVSALWGRAETVMTASCGIPNFGTQDKGYIRRFCAPGPQSALQKIIGRAPVCPNACLKETPVAAR